MTVRESTKFMHGILDGIQVLEINKVLGGKTLMLCDEGIESLRIALKSLEAWDRVRSELVDERKNYAGRDDVDGCWLLGYVLGVIDKHLEEVEGC